MCGGKPRRRGQWERGGVKENGPHTGVDDVHGAHGAACIVEDPLLVHVDMVGGGDIAVQGVHDVADDTAGVVAVGGYALLGEGVELVRAEDVEVLEALLGEVDEGAEEPDDGGEEEQEARHDGERRRVGCAALGKARV